MIEKRKNDEEASKDANEEARDWFKWMIITFVGLPVLALIFVLAPHFS